MTSKVFFAEKPFQAALVLCVKYVSSSRIIICGCNVVVVNIVEGPYLHFVISIQDTILSMCCCPSSDTMFSSSL